VNKMVIKRNSQLD